MTVVMVTKFLPLPANSGGKQRSLAVARALTSLGPVRLCAFSDGMEDLDGLASIGIEARPVPWPPSLSDIVGGIRRTRSGSAGRFCVDPLVTAVRRASEPKPEVMLVSYAQLAPMLRTSEADMRVLDLHNIESALMASYSRTRRIGMRQLVRAEAFRLARLEAASAPFADIVMTVSERDRSRLPTALRDKAIVCPNGWQPADGFEPAAEPVVAFIALMGWAPNVDAAVWFTREIWPSIVRAVPAAEMLLVGRDPAPAVRALASDRVAVTDTVPDVAPYLARARVALAPLRAGGGSRLKVIEALGRGRPVVATTVGAEGLEDLIGEGIVIADDERSFADRVVELLSDPDHASELGARGRRNVLDRYTWDRTLAPMLERIR